MNTDPPDARTADAGPLDAEPNAQPTTQQPITQQPTPAPPTAGQPTPGETGTSDGDVALIPGTNRRTALLALAGGALGGGLIGSWLPGPGLPGLPRGGRQTGTKVSVHGGDDIRGARANALRVWELTPGTRDGDLHAQYVNVGLRSSEQIDSVRNLLALRATDLTVIDPQYLPELVGKKQIRTFDEASTQSLRDLGCFPGLISQCTVDGTLYAVPLNADAPMLVVNSRLLGAADQRRAAALSSIADARQFWTEASLIAAGARVNDGTVLLQTGAYEGMTVCLVELIGAFGGDVGSDPAMTRPENQEALSELRTVFDRRTFMLPRTGKGDENATVDALQRNAVAVARLWPAQCHGLTTGPPADEAKAGDYLIVPVPGGVLGGQVLALAAGSSRSGAAQEAANFLAQPLSQLQLFSAAGYVPTLEQVHAVTSVRDELRALGSRLERAPTRPSLRRYTEWSELFSEVVRSYLLHTTDDVQAGVSQPLARFARPEA